VKKLRISLEESLIKSNRPVSIAVNELGVKARNGGDCIRRIWKVKKGYLKIHFAVDIKTGQVVSMNVSSEKVGDRKRLKRLANRARGNNVRVKKVLAYGTFDLKVNLDPLTQEGISPVNRIRKGSVPRSRGSQAGKLAVI
jgi:hypothetical protein